jgi:hypothetical protein
MTKKKVKKPQQKKQVKTTNVKKSKPVKPSKTELVKRHLLEKKPITKKECIQKYKTARLSAIVYELKLRGIAIDSKQIKTPHGKYVVYELKSKKNKK